MRRIALAAAALALAGCGGVVPQKPVACGAPLGIDVAHHQGLIDWQVVASRVGFAFIKATEGGDYLDPLFRRNWLLAEAAGVRRGAYHFMTWCRPAEDQARWFVSNVPADPDALAPVLDIEWNPESRSCPGKIAREPALAAIRVVLAAMERTYGTRPILYVPADMYRDVVEGEFAGYPLWVRGLAGRPHAAYGERRWLIWQYAESGRVPGIRGDVDLDCWSGEDRPS